MFREPVIVSLPIEDRQRSYDFYAEGLGFETAGEPAEDGLPEPLQLVVNEGLRIMLIPTGGFGWITGDDEVASPGTTEVLLSVGVDREEDVDSVMAQAEAVGATVRAPAGVQPWGYAGTFADPDGHLWMVTSEPAPG
jgi:predicted lactoylglutathione lyase